MDYIIDIEDTFKRLSYYDFKDIKLIKLQRLNLSNNNFRFIPKSIEVLKSLERLNFSYNYIRYVHNEVCLLPSLKHLNLFYNDIQSLFKNIIFLNKVQYINLNRNLIIYFSIDYLKYCRSVRHMIIHRNPRDDKKFKHNPYLLRFENDRNNDKVIKDLYRLC